MNGAATGVNVRDEAVGGENRGVAGPCEGADVRAGCQRVRSVEEGLHVRCAACRELRDPIRPSRRSAPPRCDSDHAAGEAAGSGALEDSGQEEEAAAPAAAAQRL